MMKILITGITGSLGSALHPRLLGLGYTVIGYSRCEQKQRLITPHKNLINYLGDVRDRDRLIEASRDCDMIFHLAALKCVDTLEANPEESVRTNVEGTANVLHAQRVNKIPRVVLSSTDKAVYPINVYGMSKAIAEKLTLRNPFNIVCRYGNVIGSRGSVVPMFVKSLREEKKVRITDAKMTRFWLTIDEAAAFVSFIGLNSDKGGLFIPPVQASPVKDVASTIADLIGVSEYEVEDVGIRPGEKIHECLRGASEGDEIFSSDEAHRFTPSHLKQKLKAAIGGMECRP